MSRDNGLFALAGILVGFVMAYFAFEAMSTRQPALRPPGAGVASVGAGAVPAATSGGAGSPGGAAASPEAQRGFEQVQQLRRHVAENPEDADAVLTLANLNFEIRSYTRSRDLYLQFLNLRPGDPDVMTDLGVSYRNLGEPQQALEQFRKAREVQADHWISLFNEVVVQAFDLKDFPGAQVGMARLRELQPDNPDVTRLAEEIARRQAESG